MKNKHRKSLFFVLISAAIIFLLCGFFFIWVFVAMVVTVAVLRTYAYKAFGCVTGDMLGATNEINRIISLLVLLATVSRSRFAQKNKSPSNKSW